MENITEILNIDSKAKIKNVKKGDILQRQGDITTKAYFVKKGLLRSYIIDDKGKEHIFMFASKGWIIADIESQEFNHATDFFIDSLEDSEILIFDRTCFLVSEQSQLQLKNTAHLMARRIAVLQKRIIMLMSESASERYKYFLETYPELPNRVSQKMIASYLGIMPQTLSAIRNKLSRVK